MKQPAILLTLVKAILPKGAPLVLAGSTLSWVGDEAIGVAGSTNGYLFADRLVGQDLDECHNGTGGELAGW